MRSKKYISLLLSVLFVTSCLISSGITSVFATGEEQIWNRADYYEETMTAHSQFDVSDPMHVTDEEFFGVYDGSKWTTEPSFNYAKYPDMAAIEKAAKAGDYAKCKDELLKYYQEKFGKLDLGTVGGQALDERSRVKAEAVFDNMFFAEFSDTVAGRITFNKEAAWRSADMTDEIKRVAKGSVYAGEKKIKYHFVAARKDGYLVEFDSRETSNIPYVEVRAGGKTQKYYAISDTYVVCGQPNTKFGDSTKLLVEESVSSIGVSARPVDENTKTALIQFDFSDLPAEEQIEDAKLYLYGQMKESDTPGGVRVESDTKSLYIKSWQASTDNLNEATMDYATYDAIGICYQSFDGEGYPYYTVTDDFQFIGHQHVIGMREYLNYVYNGYLATGEEIFAYHFIRVMQGLIKSVGDYEEWERVSNLSEKIYYYPFEIALIGHTVSSWIPHIAMSQSMTPDAWTNIVKHLLLCGEFLVNNWLVLEENGNYGIHSTNALGMLSMYYPEFCVVDDPLGEIKNPERPGSIVGGWTEVTKYRLAHKILVDFYEDGRSTEIPTNYALDSVTSALNFAEIAKSLKTDPSIFYSDELIERLAKACEWQLGHFNPRFGDWQVGDSGTYNTRNPRLFTGVLEMIDSPYLTYANSWREKGEEPPYLTRVDDVPGKVTFRNSWEETAVAAHMENSGAMLVVGDYTHGHNDDLSLTLYAYGQYLLVDPMMGYYDVTEPKERWASSTRGHSTIEINQTGAKGHKYYEDGVNVDLFGETMNVPDRQYGDKEGSLYPDNREINNTYDFVRGETFGYTDNNALDSDYQVLRDVLFMHDGYFIVTDYINPEDSEEVNSYIQPWHFLPESNVSVDEATYTARSNFEEAANVIVATVQKDNIEAPVLKRGLYARGKNKFGETPYPVFKQENKGITTFSTLLYPIPAGEDAKVTTEALSLDIPDTQANAFRANVTDSKKGTVKTISYYTLFDQAVKANRTFGDYATDGEVALVDETDGKINSVVLRNGRKLKDLKSNALLIYSKNNIKDLGVTWKDGAMYISSSKLTGADDALLDGLAIMAVQSVKKVYLNDTPISFKQQGKYIYFYN